MLRGVSAADKDDPKRRFSCVPGKADVVEERVGLRASTPLLQVPLPGRRRPKSRRSQNHNGTGTQSSTLCITKHVRGPLRGRCVSSPSHREADCARHWRAPADLQNRLIRRQTSPTRTCDASCSLHARLLLEGRGEGFEWPHGVLSRYRLQALLPLHWLVKSIPEVQWPCGVRVLSTAGKRFKWMEGFVVRELETRDTCCLLYI